VGALVQSMLMDAVADAWSSEVTRAAGGDRDAYRRLVDGTRATVASIALALLGDVAASEDVAQEVYLAVWLELPRLRNPASFLPWLRQLTRNRAHDAVRRGVRRPVRLAATAEALDGAVDPRPDAAAALVGAEEERALRAALDALATDEREVLTLFYREGGSVAQVAALLGLGEAAVKKRLQRARERLRADTLARLEGVLARTAPTAAFTAIVMGALATGAPATATAATLAAGGALAQRGAGALAQKGAGTMAAKGAGKLVAAKLAVVLGGAAVGVVSGVFGALFGIRRLVARARDAGERRALWRVGWVNAAGVIACGFGMRFADELVPNVGAAASFLLLVALIGFNHFVTVPRIIAPREALERAADPEAARRQRRERLRGALGLVFGALAGGASLAWALWHRAHLH